MKKRIIPALSAILCCLLVTAMLAACGGSAQEDPATPPPAQDSGGTEATPAPPKAIYTLDFADGKSDFVFVNTAIPGVDKNTTATVKQADGGNALAITSATGTSCIAIDAGALLGDKVTEVKTIVTDVFIECPDGRFRTVSGELIAINDSTTAGRAPWTVYLDTRNPNQSVFELGDGGFAAGAANLLEFHCNVNGPADKGETPAIVYIKSITFYNAANEGIAIDTSAKWGGPAEYGVPAPNYELPVAGAVEDGNFFEFYTWGADGETGAMTGPDNRNTVGVDDYLPWDVLAASYGIAFEVAEPEANLVFICFGAYNNWGWTQNDDQPYTYEDGVLTMMWRDTAFDPGLVTEDKWAVKLRLGTWSGPLNASSAWLIMG